MQEFDKIGEDLFNKIRGRFPSITIGNEAGEVINEPTQARFFDFEYKEGDKILGNVSVNITEDEGMTIIFSKDFISNEDSMTKDNWYSFLKELRLFAKKQTFDCGSRCSIISSISGAPEFFVITSIFFIISFKFVN